MREKINPQLFDRSSRSAKGSFILPVDIAKGNFLNEDAQSPRLLFTTPNALPSARRCDEQL